MAHVQGGRDVSAIMSSSRPPLMGNASVHGIDIPERYELFLLGEGEQKVTVEPETRMYKLQSCPAPLHALGSVTHSSGCFTGVPNAAVFTFNKEDHTLGNLLRARLIKSPHIRFAAYKIPHPLFAKFELRVQTDGEVTPKDAVVAACADIVQDLQKLDQEFTKEWELKKIAGQGGTAF